MAIAGYTGPERPADEDLAKCTRCGLCEQACPTYRDLRVEADSPRGRVFLMKQVADGEAAISPHLAEHLYLCLGCRACETACPSGVPYGRLLEYGRYQIEARGELTPARRGWRLFRSFAFERVFPSGFFFALAMAPAQLLQRLPALRAFIRSLPMPARWRRMLDMIPAADERATGELPERVPPEGARRARAGLFTGCVMGSLFGHVHEATVRVLRHNGCEVIVPRGYLCCGALNVHAGERDRAKTMARKVIDAFGAYDVDAVIVNSAGCGAVMKEYGELLQRDAECAERAIAFSAKVRDVSEYLAELEPLAGTTEVRRRVTYQDACHLAHGQRVRRQPRALLQAIPGLEFAEMQWADRCCGAAGVYNLTQPEMSERILSEKLDSIEQTGADVVVVGNPGCHMQLQAGLASRGSKIRVRHVVEMLDEAYRSPSRRRSRT